MGGSRPLEELEEPLALLARADEVDRHRGGLWFGVVEEQGGEEEEHSAGLGRALGMGRGILKVRGEADKRSPVPFPLVGEG